MSPYNSDSHNILVESFDTDSLIMILSCIKERGTHSITASYSCIWTCMCAWPCCIPVREEVSNSFTLAFEFIKYCSREFMCSLSSSTQPYALMHAFTHVQTQPKSTVVQCCMLHCATSTMVAQYQQVYKWVQIEGWNVFLLTLSLRRKLAYLCTVSEYTRCTSHILVTTSKFVLSNAIYHSINLHVCVCVCVCVRERERERLFTIIQTYGNYVICTCWGGRAFELFIFTTRIWSPSEEHLDSSYIRDDHLKLLY